MAVFAKVVQTQGFSRAARELNLTTSAVSRHIQRLEQHLGARLLVRTTRRLAPTELGQEVYACCCRIVEDAKDIETMSSRYQQSPQGKLRVSAPVTLGQIWLAPLLAEFSRIYPAVTVELSLLDRFVDMIEEGYDLVLRISKDMAPGLAVRPLQLMRYILIASPAYLDKHGKPTHPTQLVQHQFTLFGYADFDGDWYMRSAKDEQIHIRVHPTITVNNSTAMLSVVEQHGGISLLPDYVAANALKTGKVVRLLPDWEFEQNYAPRHIVVAYHPTRHLALKARVFIDFLHSHPFLHDDVRAVPRSEPPR
ncbi:LysR family transcriptional regulator [Undibacterium sp. CY7W]|uniref:LysR family transcriptional regulator n=2 Tax=Undibacterium rugosum TaxID=2762291 RepID=A0A923I2U4_9BURK|nr:LysR family transcriptional regulator [Undibacterium rugosum]MBR7780188.1 LysR family transcriptional regulator [Undibacterium rugosum]